MQITKKYWTFRIFYKNKLTNHRPCRSLWRNRSARSAVTSYTDGYRKVGGSSPPRDAVYYLIGKMNPFYLFVPSDEIHLILRNSNSIFNFCFLESNRYYKKQMSLTEFSTS